MIVEPLRKLTRYLIRPVMAVRERAYYWRPHCRWPWIREGNWGVIHIVCGNPPVDVVDLTGLGNIVERLKSGNEALAVVLPKILAATADDTAGLAVCSAHKAMLLDEVVTLFDSATPQEREALKKWLGNKGDVPTGPAASDSA